MAKKPEEKTLFERKKQTLKRAWIKNEFKKKLIKSVKENRALLRYIY